MHRTVMKAFPDDLESGQERALYRLEAPGRGRPLVLLVQSRMPPDWSFLGRAEAKDYLLVVPTPNPAVKDFQASLSAGQSLAFRLLANPTVKRKFPNGDHKRVGIYDAGEQIAWLQRKGQQGGFEVLAANLSNEGMVKGTITRKGRKTHALKLLAVRFDGVLRVTDGEALSETLGRGIGSGKGFGFGLLSLAPARY
jgi:CRISPR system Cascade subunit CasE